MKDRLRIKFENTLRSCYFCKDNKYESAYERIFAESALRKLWEYKAITVKGIRYTRQEIRKIMLNEMIPETVENALMYFREMHIPMTSDALARKIFEYAVDSDEASQMLIAVKRLNDFRKEEVASTELLSKVKVREVLSRAE